MHGFIFIPKFNIKMSLRVIRGRYTESVISYNKHFNIKGGIYRWIRNIRSWMSRYMGHL